jgi:hypothetical protein
LIASPHGEVSAAMREYLASKHGGAASSGGIKAALVPKLGNASVSSYRSALHHGRYFGRVSHSLHRLHAGV